MKDQLINMSFFSLVSVSLQVLVYQPVHSDIHEHIRRVSISMRSRAWHGHALVLATVARVARVCRSPGIQGRLLFWLAALHGVTGSASRHLVLAS